MTSTNINSHDYWNSRFDNDWESSLGKEQSRFFAHVALANMPNWVRSMANQEKWTICDWGCAQGDGTDVLGGYFYREGITGIDFAESAVEKARATYPGLRFEAQDWLKNGNGYEKFDLVFSSNTLEHFVDPFSVLEKLFQRAKQCVVLALPYRELNRIPEHFFTFTAENIPLIAAPDWILIHSAVVDCRTMDPTYWAGEQIILVYVNRERAAANKLALADAALTSNAMPTLMDPTPELVALRTDSERIGEDISTIKTELLDLSKRWVEITTKSSEKELEIQRMTAERTQLAADCEEIKEQLMAMERSISWRITSPFRAVAAGIKRIIVGK